MGTAKLSISSWSLHRRLTAAAEVGSSLQIKDLGKISLLDFPKLCVEKFSVDAVELCQMHFRSTSWNYVEQVKDALKRAGVKVVNVPVDIGYAAESDAVKRGADFQVIKLWFYIARALGSPSIRVNTGRGTGEDALQRAIEGYKELVKTAEETGVKLLIENHGGISDNPDNITRIIEEVKSQYLGICPDIGNFSPKIRYEALEKLADYAMVVHAKTYDFNEVGEESTIDVRRCVEILKQKGFDGYYTIEFEGKGDQMEGIEKSLTLLRRYL